MEVHLHTGMLVGPDFLTRRPNHDGGLWPLNNRLGSDAGRPILLGHVDGCEIAGEELVLLVRAVTAARGKFAGVNLEGRAGNEIIAILILARMLFQFED